MKKSVGGGKTEENGIRRKGMRGMDIGGQAWGGKEMEGRKLSDGREDV